MVGSEERVVGGREGRKGFLFWFLSILYIYTCMYAKLHEHYLTGVVFTCTMLCTVAIIKQYPPT